MPGEPNIDAKAPQKLCIKVTRKAARHSEQPPQAFCFNYE